MRGLIFLLLATFSVPAAGQETGTTSPFRIVEIPAPGRTAVAGFSEERRCGCRDALRNAVLTSPDAIPAAARERLALLLDPILGAEGGGE